MMRGWLRMAAKLGVALGAAVLLLPLVYGVLASFRAEAELFARPGALPSRIVLEHYRALFVERGFLRPIVNSIVVSLGTTLLALLFGAPCAYAIARLRFRGKRVLLSSILVISMFPQIAIVSPLYLMLRALGLINTYPGLVLPYLTFAMPLSVWLLVGHFSALRRWLEEAALIDGASRWRALCSVVLPVAFPGIATAAILTFIYAYNEFLFALSFSLGPELQTAPVAIALMRGRYQVPWGQVMAAAMVATLPVALLVLGFQRRIVKSFAAGGGR